MKNNNVKTLEYSFKAAYVSVPRNCIGKVKRELKEIFQIISDEQIYSRINGKVEPKLRDARAVEELFKSYGIKVEWGKAPETFINEPAESN